MNLSEIDWDIENAGEWPNFAKVLVIGIVCALIVGAWIYLDTRRQLEDLRQLRNREASLKQQVDEKLKRAVHLPRFRQHLSDLEKSLGELLRQLPDSTEVPELLVDISQTGLAAGLEFQLFQPQAEMRKEFYAELPIDIQVVGTYSEFGNFVSGIASLPRIVTVHDVKISKNRDAAELTMKAQLKTYRQAEESFAPPEPVQKPGQPRKR